MTSDFQIWFETGLTHILDLNGYDHILFVSLLAITFSLKEFNKLLWLITAFTIGHSLTLALSAINLINTPQPIIELAISLSILATALLNLLNKNRKIIQVKVFFLITLFFGLIHGLGFSYLLKNMLGREQNITLPLLYFNIGLEAGQIIIVGIVLLMILFATNLLKINYELIKKCIAICIGLISLYLVAMRLISLFNYTT